MQKSNLVKALEALAEIKAKKARKPRRSGCSSNVHYVGIYEICRD